MTSRARPLRRAKSLTDRAADEIRTRIVRGDFELGAPLSENRLALDLGVSKTPIREAMLQLKSEGLVSIQPQRGSFVFTISFEELLELGELREVLETAALRLAAARHARRLAQDLGTIIDKMTSSLEHDDIIGYRMLDGEFHRTLFERSGNRYLLATYHGIAFRIQALRTRLSSNATLNNTSFEDHRRLTKLICSGRFEEAASLLSRHVSGTTDDYATSMKSGHSHVRHFK